MGHAQGKEQQEAAQCPDQRCRNPIGRKRPRSIAPQPGDKDPEPDIGQEGRAGQRQRQPEGSTEPAIRTPPMA